MDLFSVAEAMLIDAVALLSNLDPERGAAHPQPRQVSGKRQSKRAPCQPARCRAADDPGKFDTGAGR
jgi:hypothetical protein